MKEYEIVKEIFNPCAGDNCWAACEITEQELDDPICYVQEQYINETNMEYTFAKKDNSLVIEAVYLSGIKHRYTFSEF